MPKKKKSPLVVANWKMKPATKREAFGLWRSVKKKTQSLRGVDIVVCPSYPYLALILEEYNGSKIALGAQDASSELEGSFTGEVSSLQVADPWCLPMSFLATQSVGLWGRVMT